MNKLIIPFFSISAILLVALLFSLFNETKDLNADYIVRGEFDPKLKSLNSINSFNERVSQIQIMNKVNNEDTSELVGIIDRLLRQRFYHGTSRYNLNENWVAWAAGEFLWDDLRMIVEPNELLKRNTAACNQISIVFHRILKTKGITFRPVGLQRHLITEIKYDGKWNYHDPDYEVSISPTTDAESLLKDRALFKSTYLNTFGESFNKNFQELLETRKPNYYTANEELAIRLKIAQDFFYFISFYGWILFGSMGLVLYLWTYVRH